MEIKYEINVGGSSNPIVGVAELRPCPFCGSGNIELINTHTPSCWVECLDCEGQAHGEPVRPKGNYQTRKHFEQAIKSAIKAWNRRP